MSLLTRISRAITAFKTEPVIEKPKPYVPASKGFGESARGLLEVANARGNHSAEYRQSLRKAAEIFAYCEQIAIAREALGKLCTQQVIVAKKILEDGAKAK